MKEREVIRTLKTAYTIRISKTRAAKAAHEKIGKDIKRLLSTDNDKETNQATPSSKDGATAITNAMVMKGQA